MVTLKTHECPYASSEHPIWSSANTCTACLSVRVKELEDKLFELNEKVLGLLIDKSYNERDM